MKSKIIAGAIGFVLGAGVGAVTTYFVLREKVDRTINEEVEAYKAHLRNRVAEETVQNASESDSEGSGEAADDPGDEVGKAEDEGASTPLKKPPRGSQERPSERIVRTDYTSYYIKPEPDELLEKRSGVVGGSKSLIEELNRVGQESGDDDFNQHFAEREAPVEDTEYQSEEDALLDEECAMEAAREEMLKYEDENDGKPYVIPMTEFDYGREWYDKITLTYYEQDDVLCDESEEVITNIDGIVGIENLTHFGDGSCDDDVVYIRNPAVDTDFMVVRVNASYAEQVCGFVQEPKFKRRDRRGRDEEDG